MSSDPFRSAFKTRRESVAAGVDTTASLAELQHRGAAAQRRRTFSAAAVALVVIGGIGLAWSDRFDGRAEPTEVATAADITGTSTGPRPTGATARAASTPAPDPTALPEPPSTDTTTSTTTATTTSTTAAVDVGPPAYPVPILATGSSLAEFPCVLDNETLVAASNAATNGPYAAPLGPVPGTGIVGITRQVDEGCERTVITLDGPGFAEGTTAAGTATGIRIDLPGVMLLPGAELDPSALYVDGGADQSYVDLRAVAGATIVSYGDNPARVIVDHRPSAG